MHLESMHIYPIKGCAEVPVAAWQIGARGLAWDRHFMVVDEHGRFLTQRQHPALATVVPELTDDQKLRITAAGGVTTVSLVPPTSALNPAGRLEVEVWGFRAPAEDAGDAAAGLLSEHLGQPVRLVRVPSDYPRRADPVIAGPGVPVSFSDGYPLLITNTASLDALNGWLADPLPMERFRPNLVIGGTVPWAEDRWRKLRINGIDIDLVSPCTRCAVTTVDQATGQREGPEPLRTLAMFRRGPDGVEFGWNAVPRSSGTISAQDEVVVVDNGSHDYPRSARPD